MEEDFKTTPLTPDALNEHALKNGNGDPDCEDCRDESVDLTELARIPGRMLALERQLHSQEAALYVLVGVLIYLAWKVTD